MWHLESFHATRGIKSRFLVPRVASLPGVPRMARRNKIRCHAWHSESFHATRGIKSHFLVPRVAPLPGSPTTRGPTPPALPPARFMCHVWHARRPLRPPPGSRATRGLTPHAPPRGGACATRGMNAAPRRPCRRTCWLGLGHMFLIFCTTRGMIQIRSPREI